MISNATLSASSAGISMEILCNTTYDCKKGESYLDIKPVRHIGFLDYTLKDFTPEFYATYQLLNVKNHEIYSSKFALSVVNLNQIELVHRKISF